MMTSRRFAPDSVLLVRAAFRAERSAVAQFYETAGYPVGMSIDFNELKLADGISRLILPGSNMESELTE
jgi:hypothetical protein